MNKLIEKSLLQKIERFEAFEDRMEIRMENFQIKMGEHGYFQFFSEIHPVSGTTIKEATKIECVVYDTEGLIIQKERRFLSKDSFFGFDILEFTIKYQDDIGKIRIYPQKG